MTKQSQDVTGTAACIRPNRRLFTYSGLVALGVFSATLSFPASASAQVAEVSTAVHTVHTEVATQATAVSQFWTAARLRSARPIEATLREAADGLPMASDTAAAFSGRAVKGSGGLPSIEPGAALQKTLIPQEALLESETTPELANNIAGVTPNSSSSFGATFTTSRVFPDAASVAYPYRTAGKLFFHDPRTGGNFVCSASVLRPRIIVTAGHCVTHPSPTLGQRYFYTNFIFVPAYNNGVAPYGVWTPTQEWVTTAWYYSDGSVPNQQDVAIIVAKDQGVKKIGNVTGWLGYYTNQLANNEVTMLGYPCNLDSCLKMQETFAHTYQYGGNNTYIFGSAMKGGASGGPWIRDFGVAPAGAPAGLLGNNYLVAVTSYGPVNPALMYLGASNLDSRFLSLLTSACNATAGNCQ